MIARIEQENKVKMEQKRQPNLCKVMIWTFVVSIVMMFVLYMYSYKFPIPLKKVENSSFLFDTITDFDIKVSDRFTSVTSKDNVLNLSILGKTGSVKVPGELISLNKTHEEDVYIMIYKSDNDYFAQIIKLSMFDRLSKKTAKTASNKYKIATGDFIVSTYNSEEDVFFVWDKDTRIIYEYNFYGKQQRTVQLTEKAAFYKIQTMFYPSLLVIDDGKLTTHDINGITVKPYKTYDRPFIIKTTYYSYNYFLIFNGKSFDLLNYERLEVIKSFETNKKFTQLSKASMYLNSDDGTYIGYLKELEDRDNFELVIEKILDEPIQASTVLQCNDNLSGSLISGDINEENPILRWIEYYWSYETLSYKHQVLENYFSVEGKIKNIFADFNGRKYVITTKGTYEVPYVGQTYFHHPLFGGYPYNRLNSNLNWFVDKIWCNFKDTFVYSKNNENFFKGGNFIGFLIGMIVLSIVLIGIIKTIRNKIREINEE